MGSRRFERSFTTDQLTLSAGTSSGIDGGPICAGIVFNLDDVSNFQLLYQAQNAGNTEVWALAIDSGQLFFCTAAPGGCSSGPSGLSTGVWYQYVFTKATGSSTVRDHLHNHTTNVWTHANRGTINDAGNGPVDHAIMSQGSSARVDGLIAAFGIGTTIPATDGDVEAFTGLNAWNSAGMTSILRLADTPVNDLVDSMNQTALSGTTVDAAEPSAARFDLSFGTVASATPLPVIGPNGAVVRASVW